MSHDPKKKTSKTFQCREYLWEIFEELSEQLDCSTDFLLNEAMRLYARTRADENKKASEILSLPWNPIVEKKTLNFEENNASEKESEGFQDQGKQEETSEKEVAQGNDHPKKEDEKIEDGFGFTPTPVPSASENILTEGDPPEEPSMMNAASSPPPLPTHSNTSGQKSVEKGSLYLHFEDQKALVDKDEFIIGRSARNADFAIRDANISRRHAAVVFEEGVYKIKDLGSTNGVEFEGTRVKEKEIKSGDSFKLCNFEVRFTDQ